MKATEPGGELYEAAKQEGVDVARKVNEAKGPITFNAAEAEVLRVILFGLQRSLDIAQKTNQVIRAALVRKHLQIVHHELPDGSFTVDLVKVAPAQENEPVTH